MHPGYKSLDDYNKYPNASNVLDLVFFVGCSPTISDAMIEYISFVVSSFGKWKLFIVDYLMFVIKINYIIWVVTFLAYIP